MFDVVATTTKEVAGATVLTLGLADATRSFTQIGGFE